MNHLLCDDCATKAATLLTLVRPALLSIQNRVLALLNTQSTFPTSIIERDFGLHWPSQLVTEEYHRLLDQGVEFFVLSSKMEETGLPMFAEKMTVESDKTKLGALTYNRCRQATYLLWRMLGKALDGMFQHIEVCVEAKQILILFLEHVEHIEWRRAAMKPKSLYTWEDFVGKEVIYGHDFLVLHGRDGGSIVFDPTSYQFGIEDFSYIWEEYEARFIVASKETVGEEEEAVMENEAEDDNSFFWVLKNFRARLEYKSTDELLLGEFWEEVDM
ncbi:hypothetical protein GQ44DRAFT_819063 [Phaeosphaeriaceae sp. PMI808]|nr:hypothetical protein GQ44DRAFT_819063 [Phaeosphaeriaceae sp. PMI808]